MLMLRLTQKLAKRMKVKIAPAVSKSTGRLGDWYATDLVLKRKPFIICVSENGRLPVLLHAAPFAEFPERFPLAVEEMLRALSIPEHSIQEEVLQMQAWTLAKTENRSIMGTLNEYGKHLEWRQDELLIPKATPLHMALKLAGMPSLVMDAVFPEEAVSAIFGFEAFSRKLL